MSLSVKKFSCIIGLLFAFCLYGYSQVLTREFNVAAGGTVEVVNKFGRIGAKTVADIDGKPAASKLTATSPKPVTDAEIKISNVDGHVLIVVAPADPKKRIDLTMTFPERTKIKVETLAGAIEATGNFASIDARTDTGTISAYVPSDDLNYHFIWTESKPRYLADFDIAEVKEKSAGRFEVKGRRTEATVVTPPRRFGNDETEPEVQELKKRKPKSAPENPSSVALDFTTARGILLLNVPPGEVMSDLRERPLTEAAKAIVRSGDSLLMEAIRRAAPKYYGDYTRSLPPLVREPSFAAKSVESENPNAKVKTASVRVTDVRNRSVVGLKAADFEVTEGGKPREIVSVEKSTAAFNLVLLLDVSGSIENYVDFIRKAARNFVNTVGKDDRVSIVIFNEDVKMLSRFTTDKRKLSESLDTFDSGGGTAYYDALAYTIADTLRPMKGDRTAIVVLTDGDDNRSFLAFDSLTGSIQESGALIYPLYVPSGLIALAAQNANADIDPLRKKYMSLTAKSEGEGDKLAKISGGVYYPITQLGQIQKAYEDIVDQMRSAYNITYRSEIEPTGPTPRLKVKAKKGDVFTSIGSIKVADM
ncbi:hypothetical protein BH10ACI2_BH10ACI2_13260 [soil metagenome]